MQRATTRAGAMLCLLLACATYSGSAMADDTVLLKNGGRVRGTVMEENPQTGVRIQLADGTVRQVAPGEVDRVEYGATTPPQPLPAPGVPPPVAPITQPQTIGAGAGVPVTGYGGPMMLPRPRSGATRAP